MGEILVIIDKLPVYINLVLPLMAAIIAIALVIPGEQPEKFLQAAVDFLKKFSKK